MKWLPPALRAALGGRAGRCGAVPRALWGRSGDCQGAVSGTNLCCRGSATSGPASSENRNAEAGLAVFGGNISLGFPPSPA